MGESTQYFRVIDADPDFEGVEAECAFAEYGELDELGRCGVAVACVCADTMPVVRRKSIASVTPTGWHSVKYRCIGSPDSDHWLYERCHLIAFSLTGESDNPRNIITGTVQMNRAMMAFERMVSCYAKGAGVHVLYRVTPDFRGGELVARGVHVEAASVEDGGRMSFNAYVPNAQEGIDIDYATGDSRISGRRCGRWSGRDGAYFVNESTGRFHLSGCRHAGRAEQSELSRCELVARGCEGCKRCGA